jgi:hypothetical protein
MSQELFAPNVRKRKAWQPRYRIVCRKVRVLDRPRLGISPQPQPQLQTYDPLPPVINNSTPMPNYEPVKLGDVYFDDAIYDDWTPIGDNSSVGASIGLTDKGANASVNFGWGWWLAIAGIGGYVIYTQVLQKKGLGLPIIG